MDRISYQNGFICGLAAKGLTHSGQLYQPVIYNDDGQNSYLYMDFRRAMQSFSMGQLSESLIIYDNAPIGITGFEKVTETIYKIFAALDRHPHGITVINKSASRLRFANGDVLPPFSVHAFITGQTSYIDGGYYYERLQFERLAASCSENSVLLLNEPISTGVLSEAVFFSTLPATVTEASAITLLTEV